MSLSSIWPWILGACLAARPGAADSAVIDPWPGQRGECGGQAVLRWSPPPAPNYLPYGESLPPTEINEWRFTGKGTGNCRPDAAAWVSPALASVGGRPMAFIGGCDQAMHGLDLLTQKEAWSKTTNGPIENSAVVGFVAGKPTVFFGSSDRFLYACDAPDRFAALDQGTGRGNPRGGESFSFRAPAAGGPPLPGLFRP